MKILRGGGRLSYLDIVARGELEIALDARAGVLGALAFVAMRQKQDEAGEQIPLVFTGREELVDDDLRAVGKVAELRFPQRECLWVIAAVAVLETHDGSFGKRRVVNIEARLIRADMGKRNVDFFVFNVDQRRVALIERSAA